MSSEGSTGSGRAKKIAAAAAAVALAAVLMIGGTISYLSSSTDTVTNTFDTPTIDVDIEETTDGYTIIPGTSEDKDPTVTITTGVDAYVYLVVEDNTNGLVEYEIDTTVWTLLYTYDEDSCVCYDDDGGECSETCECGFCADGTVYVYYTTVSASDSEYELDVLVNSTVSYSSAITNEDVKAYEDGDLTLSFTAYAIQMAPFYEASDSEDENDEESENNTEAIEAGAEKAFLFAYYNINPDENVTGKVALVCTESKLKAALEDDDVEYILLVDNIAVTLTDSTTANAMVYELTVTKDTTLDLQSYTLSFDLNNVDSDTLSKGTLTGVPVLIGVTGGSLTIVADEDGAVDASAGLNTAYAVVVYDSDSSDNSDTSVTINGGTYTGASHVIYVVKGSATINDGYFQFDKTWETYIEDNLSSSLSYYLGFMLNCYDRNRSAGTASIVVYGGSYVNFNPADCVAEGTSTSFVAEGYTVTSTTGDDGDTVYTVVEKSSVEDNSSVEEESEEESEEGSSSEE